MVEYDDHHSDPANTIQETQFAFFRPELHEGLK
jgi:hypothetical protein